MRSLRVQVADTPSRQARGLMFVTAMPDDCGMIFLFKRPQKMSFWGVNTFIPLDIAFVDPHNKIAEIKHISPSDQNPVRSKTDCVAAVEANLGYFSSNKICVGDIIHFDDEGDGNGLVSFEQPMKTAQQVDFFDKNKPFIGTREEGSQNVATEDDGQKNLWMLQDALHDYQEERQNLPQLSIEDLMGSLEDERDERGDVSLEVEPMLPPEDPNAEVEPHVEMPEPEFEQPEEEPVPVPEGDYPDFDSQEDAMRWSGQNRQTVHIWYTTKSGRDIERDVEPHGMFSAKTTGNDILVTYDRTVGDIRAFIMGNIMFHQFLDDEFDPKFIVK